MQTKEKLFALDSVAAAALMTMNDGVMPKGMVRWQYVDEDGKVVPGSGKFCNLVVDAGKTYFAARASSTPPAVVGWIAIGSGTTAVAAGQTALTTETARAALASATNTANVLTCIGTIPAGSGTGTVEEVGLFNAVTVGTLVARALTGTITKPAGLGLQFTWTITVG